MGNTKSRKEKTSGEGTISKTETPSKKRILLKTEMLSEESNNKWTNVSMANNHLAIHLYKLLAKEKKNVFFSPFSISTALAMLFCGSCNETAKEMRNVLGYDIADIADDLLKCCYQELLKALESNQDFYTLTIVNSAVSDKRFSVKEEFKSLLKEYFNARFQEVDFLHESESAVEEINEWVKEKTHDMIPQLINELNSNTVMVLLNAVYFKGFWLNKFHEGDTYPQNFYNKGVKDGCKKVDMMHLKEKILYAEKDSFKVLQLPYRGEDVAMLILLPSSRNGLEMLENSLGFHFLQDLKKHMHARKVEVALPKFKLEYSKELKKQFKDLGMNRVFSDDDADLNGISDEKEIFVSKIIHKAVLEVNEEGSEASAATAVVVAIRSVSTDNPEFIVDHPFLFVIFNSKSDLILFMGRVDEL